MPPKRGRKETNPTEKDDVSKKKRTRTTNAQNQAEGNVINTRSRKIGKVTNKESEPSPPGQKQPLSPDIPVLESIDNETTIHETKNETGAALPFTHISTPRTDLVPTDQQSTKTTNRPKPKIISNTIVNRSTSSNNTNDAPHLGFSSHQIETSQQISTLIQGRAANTHPTYLHGAVTHSYGDAATTQPQSGTAATFLQFRPGD